LPILLGAGLFYARDGFVWVIREKNGEFFTSMKKVEEDPADHPRLRLLREREGLDKIVAPGETQFEKIVLLRRWAHGQLKMGERFVYPPWDAVEIVDLARKYGNKGFCAQYAILFLQACRALGLHARYVDLPGHFVVGVWSDDHDRWVVMDPMNDVHYERDGEPLRGRDLCGAYLRGDVRGIQRVDSDGRRAAVAREDLAVFREYSILLKADQLTDPATLKVNGRERDLVLAADPRTYPVIGRDSVGYGSEFLTWKDAAAKSLTVERAQSDDPDDFRQVVDQTLILPARLDPVRARAKIVLLAEGAPDLDSFLVDIDGTGWQSERAEGRLIWPLKPGVNVFRARVKTKSGWEGPVSFLQVYYLPPFFSSGRK
jgi:hypothetical protein